MTSTAMLYGKKIRQWIALIAAAAATFTGVIIAAARTIFRTAVIRTGRALAATAAAAIIALGAGLASAGTAQASAVLPPDPVAYCIMNPPYGLQVEEDGWQVQFDRLLGNSYTNNWRCEYWVSMTIPYGEDVFTLPPVTQSFPINWNAMCDQQYPGAWAVWIPGPETGVDGAPWGCQGPPGVTYDPAENSQGIHAVL